MVSLALFGAGSVAAQGGGRDERGSIVVEGRTRTYAVHLPPGYDGKGAVPLVFLTSPARMLIGRASTVTTGP